MTETFFILSKFIEILSLVFTKTTLYSYQILVKLEF